MKKSVALLLALMMLLACMPAVLPEEAPTVIRMGTH